MNKFIKKYPQFWIPKEGDRVQVKQLMNDEHKVVDEWAAYKKGDSGTIVLSAIGYSPYPVIHIRFDKGYLGTGCLFVDEVEPI